MRASSWTVESVAQSLRGLTVEDIELEASGGYDDELWPYLEAAAVRSTFDPEALAPVTPAGLDRTAAVAKLLDLSTAVLSDDGRPRWLLRTEVRRSALARLGTREAMLHAVQDTVEPAQDALQETLEGAIRGINTPLTRQDQEELARTLQVARWLHGILEGVPDPESVRQALDRAMLLEPFRRLVGDHFAGRERELRKLRSYVDVLQTPSLREALVRSARVGMRRPPLVIDGTGGVGKSTLMAKFILDHVGPDGVSELPFAYIDYDRPGVSAREPVTVLIEAARQLGAQTDLKAWNDLRDVLSERMAEWGPQRGSRPRLQKTGAGSAGDVRESRGVVLGPERRAPFLDAFAANLRDSSSTELPFLLILDTFEEVQYLGEDVVREIGWFLAELEATVPQLRTIIAGRAPIDEFDNEELHLGSLDDEAAVGFLLAHGVPDQGTATEVVSRLRGNPLTLKLAARAIQRDMRELESIRKLRSRRRLIPFISVDQEEIQGYLYRRILAHVHTEDVRKLAHPGLVLRRISPEIIREVLATACRVRVGDAADAQRLFAELRKEVTLVRPAAGNVLEHRSDVRRVMLPLIHRDEPEAADAIHRSAVAYYETKGGIEDRAEEIYHRLFLDDLRDEIDRRWLPGVEQLLEGAIDELPARGQVYLSLRTGREPRDKTVWRRADVETRTRRLEERAKELLGLRRPQEAIDVLAQGGGAGDERLRLLEAIARRDLGDFSKARRAIQEGLEQIHGLDGGPVLVDLLTVASEIEANCADAADGYAYAVDGYQAARQLGDSGRLLKLGVQRLSLVRRGNVALSQEQITSARAEILTDAMKISDERLAADLPLARMLAGELAPEQPEVLLRLVRTGALPGVTEAELDESAETLARLAADLRPAGPGADESRRLASCVSVSVQWPDTEVQRVDGIPFQERERWWVVYVSNSGMEPITDVDVTTTAAEDRIFTFRMDGVSPGRRWYVLPRDSGLYSESSWPRAQLQFTACDRRYRSTDGRLEELLGTVPERVEFPPSESREVAERLRMWIDRPDAEVRDADRLSDDENWWVVYLSVDGDRPVHRVEVTIAADVRRPLVPEVRRPFKIAFPPVEPGRRRWWIMRPDAGVDPHASVPDAHVEFDALGRRWHRSGKQLRRVRR